MHPRSELAGIAAMLVATAAFVVCDTFMKLTAESLPPFEVLFLRGVAASLATGLLLAIRGEARGLSGAVHPRALGRAGGETLSVLCYVIALVALPIADVVAMLQTAPLFLTIAAAVVLGERIGPWRVVTVAVGFAGALMVAQPGSSGLAPPALLAIASAILIAMRDLIGRGVPARIPVLVVALATNVMVMTAAGLLSSGFEDWVEPTGRHIVLLAMAGVFLTVGHAGILLAYRLGRTATIAPFFYSFALWAVVAGAIVWGTLPNPIALAGIALIVASGILLVTLDHRQRRTASPDTMAGP